MSERALSKAESRQHNIELREHCVNVLRAALPAGAAPGDLQKKHDLEVAVETFRKWVRGCIKIERPVDPQSLVVPDVVVVNELCHMLINLPDMSAYHGDARHWLKQMGPQRHRKKAPEEGVYAWNLTAGGGIPVGNDPDGPAFADLDKI